MSNFYMYVGLPGVGKSFYASKFSSCFDAIVISSDTIREEIFGDRGAQWCNNAVFSIMKLATIEALKQGKDVIYDATNINSKRRITLLEEIKKACDSDIRTEVVIFLDTIPRIIAKNNDREHRVPEEVIRKMLLSFETPYKEEGWDEINIYNVNRELKIEYDDYYNPSPSLLEDFDQRNPYHNERLLNHIKTSINHLKDIYKKKEYLSNEDEEEYLLLKDVLFNHDMGKVSTQTFDEKGIAHYYNHNNVGAYMYLLKETTNIVFLNKNKKNELLIKTKSIELHMLSLTEKALRTRKISPDSKMVERLRIIEECDKYRKAV